MADIPRLKDLQAALRVYDVLEKLFLYWVEALCLLGRMSYAVQSLQSLETLVDGEANTDGFSVRLTELIYDANRFLLHHRGILENVPLQLYAAALVFSPRQSVVKNLFRSEAPDWVSVKSLKTTWGACLKTLERHTEGIQGVWTVAYSPNGQWLVSGSRDGTVKLWNANSGNCLHTIGGHGEEYSDYSDYYARRAPAGVRSVSFSADGLSFVSGSWNGVVKVWSTVTGECLRVLEVHSSEALAMEISSDCRVIAFACSDSIIVAWKIDTETPLCILKASCFSRRGARRHVTSMAVTADGLWLASTTWGNNTTEIWNTSTGEYERLPMDDQASSVTWSLDGEWLALSGHVVQIWERKAGRLKLKARYKFGDVVGFMAFSFNKQVLAAGHQTRIIIWNTETGAQIWESDEGHSRIISICFSPNVQRLVSASFDETIKIWDISRDHKVSSGGTLHQEQNIRLVMSTWLTFLVHRRSGCVTRQQMFRLLTSYGDLAIRIWNTTTGNKTRTLYHNEEQNRFKYRFGGQKSFGTELRPEPIWALEFRNNIHLASSSGGTIKIWSTCLQTLDAGHVRVVKMAFSSDGRRLAYLSRKIDEKCDSISIWDTVTEQRFPVSTVPYMATTSLSFSADGHHWL
ncbi:hypothetical protein CSAL01_00175 [Colletotrichum salicis]|uniref:Uncharacterized protein n=1 Tax=Colletotrichum salicis TaxID=1209931 RepID=A0A135SQU8_9PEZI|nr:hypothetical protein CSAL01_00175 [Colletotrichum salicis]